MNKTIVRNSENKLPEPIISQGVKIYRKDIDGLRAFAVMPVLLFHFGAPGISGGFAGVDVFFVISGYLIAGSILTDLAQDRFSLTNFYWRRFRRILPAFVMVVLLSTMAAIFFLPSDQLVSYGWSLLAASTFWSNVHFWQATDYFATAADLTPLLHTWSLAVEEQYYFIAPIAMYSIHRYLQARWLIVLIPLGIASFGVSVYGIEIGPRFTFYWLPTRAWELMLGALLVVAPLPKIQSKLTNEIIGLFGLACLAIAYFTLTKTSVFPAQGAVIPCLGAVLLIYAGETRVAGKPATVTRILELAPFGWIGLISYSLYLVHWPLVSFATHYTLDPVKAPILLSVVSLMLAAALWKWVEQPFRTSPRLKSKGMIFGLSFVSLSFCVLLATILIAKDGFPGREADYKRVDVDTVFWRNGQCFLQGRKDISAFSVADCTHDLGFPETEILLWGDSYAAQYVAGLEENSAVLGSNVVQMTFSGCPPLLSYSSAGIPACADFNQKAFELATGGRFSVVVLTALWDIHRQRELGGLAETLEKLSAAGVSVVVIGQSPRFIDDVQRIAAHSARRGKDPWRHHVDSSDSNRNFLEHQTVDAGQIFVDPIFLLCKDKNCPLADEVDYYAFDNGHMSRRGASIALSAYMKSFLPNGENLTRWGQRK